MNRKLIPILVAILLTALTVPSLAQPCVPSYPDVMVPGQSACIQLCVGSYVAIEFDGNRFGPGDVPIIIMSAGCQQGVGTCNVQCTPITPPPSDLIYGGDPYYPNEWFGQNDCLIIYLSRAHDNIWIIEFFSFCQGCFCLTFDHQLPVELSSFTAMPGDGEVTLNWTTASESHNDHFEILRDNLVAGSVPATNNAAGSTYTFVDRNVTNGVSYRYSLVSVDENGNRQTYTQTVDATPSASSDVLVTTYALHQNYPNPFNPETSIGFDLVQGGAVKLTIYNVLGESVATLLNGPLNAGRHTVIFNGANLPSGLYLYKLEVNGFTDTKKLVLLK